MKYLAFSACLAFGIAGFFAAEYLKPFNPELRAADPAPATKCTFGDYRARPETSVKVRAEYVFVSAPGVSVRLPKSMSEVQRAEFERKTIAR